MDTKAISEMKARLEAKYGEYADRAACLDTIEAQAKRIEVLEKALETAANRIAIRARNPNSPFVLGLGDIESDIRTALKGTQP